MAVYGNRAYDNALAELQDILEEAGCPVVAAGAFIGRHSIFPKVAEGRPDQADLAQVDAFVDQLRRVLAAPQAPELQLPGNHPYRSTSPMPFHPQAGEGCTRCGLCAKICPAGAIPEEDPRSTDPEVCIDCLACVKRCPAHARGVQGPGLEAVRQKLEGMLLAQRQEPQWFF